MKIIGNLLWLLFGGVESAFGYFVGSLALACTIIGIPFALQTLKLGFLCLWPFGAKIGDGGTTSGCLSLLLNLVWLIFGGLFACLNHILWGLFLCVTIIGIPWGMQHFKLATLALAPFGRDIKLNL